MMKRLAGGWCGVLILALIALMPVSPATAAPDPYGPTIPSSCHIGTPMIAAGQRLVLQVDVTSNSSVPLHGTVGIVVTKRGAVRPVAARQPVRAKPASKVSTVWSKTVRFEGTPLRVVGPKLPRGHYAVRMSFTPDDGTFDGCVNAAAFAVGGRAPGGPGGHNGADGLPDTGGPPLFLLLLGSGLVAVGAGVVAQGHRRPRTRSLR